MNNLFEAFTGTTKEAWIELLQKELKGASPDLLQKIDPIEEIAFPSYFHRSDAAPDFSDPGKFPYSRGYHTQSNNWRITSSFACQNPKSCNQEILDSLMTGTEHIMLETEGSDTDFNVVLDQVELDFVIVSLVSNSYDQVKRFLEFTGGKNTRILYQGNQADLFDLIPLVKSGSRLFTIDAFQVQQAGATTWQEIGIALAEGHELLVQLLDAGFEAANVVELIQFQLGIDSNYFFQLSKIRAFRMCWSKIVATYASEAVAVNTTILVKSGFINISLKDPYTNLLRQTTEALSSAVAGVDDLLIQPYDHYSSLPKTSFTRRMATNISLLLKEESYIHLVVDPTGGSYALDNLTDTVAERAWSLFQEIERAGGISNPGMCKNLQEEITEKANRRVQALKDKSIKRIGINIFPNPDQTEGTWTSLPGAWNGLPTLNLEQRYEQA